MNCGECRQCVTVDHEGRYGQCVHKRRVVKVSDPACDECKDRLDGSRWEDSFGNQYIYDATQDGFVPQHLGGTFLTANYMERLRRVDPERASR